MAKDAQRPSNEALQHAIASAELYLRAYREAGPANPPRRAALRQKFNELAMLAERLKSRGTGHGTPETEPQQPTLDEKRILERSSCLHGNIFQPWRSDPLDEVFAASQGEQSYTSVMQLEDLHRASPSNAIIGIRPILQCLGCSNLSWTVGNDLRLSWAPPSGAAVSVMTP